MRRVPPWQQRSQENNDPIGTVEPTLLDPARWGKRPRRRPVEPGTAGGCYPAPTMAVPSYKIFIEPVLRYLAKCEAAVPAREVCEAAARELGLSEADRSVELSSGGPVYRNRASWALNWLKRAGLAEAPVPGEWRLTPGGRRLASAHPAFTREIMSKFAAKVEARAGGERPTRVTSIDRAAPPRTPLGNRRAYRMPSRPLSVGGQAEVYLAVRKADNRTFVLKRVRQSLGENRMRREIEVQSSLRHPNIMPILDWDVFNHSWYVMPRGTRAMADLPRPLERKLICRIVTSVAAALGFAHTAGHPHRDVKPQNIIELEEAGESRWVLADWGLTRRAPGDTTAEWTKTGQFLGSAGFAPPEAYHDAHNVGIPGDMYALGQVIAWATGVDPVPNIRPTVTAPWRELVEFMTNEDPQRRPRDMSEVQRLVAAICECGAEVPS